jgi:methionine-R-sulfoxide reductase
MKPLAFASLCFLGVVAFGCVPEPDSPDSQHVRAEADSRSPKRKDKVRKTDAEWKKQLTDIQYKILRNQGTEAAFCSPLLENKKKGVYHCVGCELPLFSSEHKFESGSGWPSFFQPVNKENIWTRPDYGYGMIREEILCARCDGHLGHVFDDGPRPTGLRFCLNGEVLKFKETKN